MNKAFFNYSSLVHCSAIALAIPLNVLLLRLRRSSAVLALDKASAYHLGIDLPLPKVIRSPFPTIFVGVNNGKFLSH